MESANPQVPSGKLQQRLDAAAHLGRRLVREGHRQNGLGADALHADQPGDAMHQHAGFAAARTREHQHGLMRRRHGFPLGVIEGID